MFRLCSFYVRFFLFRLCTRRRRRRRRIPLFRATQKHIRHADRQWQAHNNLSQNFENAYPCSRLSSIYLFRYVPCMWRRTSMEYYLLFVFVFLFSSTKTTTTTPFTFCCARARLCVCWLCKSNIRVRRAVSCQRKKMKDVNDGNALVRHNSR